MKKRLLYLLLILITLISSMTVIAYATESGSCGTNLKWTLSDAGVLTISGSGEMKEFEEINYESDRYCRDTPWRNYRDNIKKISIANGVTSISPAVFEDCKNVTSVLISGSVKNIGEYAFHRCTNLTSVNIIDGVTEISEGAFRWCRNLKSIIIPDSVTDIGEHAFDESGLTSIIIPDSVTSIGKNAFRACSDLTSANISKSITEIPEGLLRNCEKLESITIPEGVTSIGEYAFMASYLKSVKIPASVTSIGRNAFYHLLKDIYYEGTKEQWNSISIDDSITVILQGATIHYAAGANAPASSFYTIDTDKTIFNIPVNTNGVASTAGIVHVEVIGADNEQKGEGDEEFLNAADGDKVLVNVPCILKVGDIIKIYTSIK